MIISLATVVSLTCNDGEHHRFPATLSRLQIVVVVVVAVAVHLWQTAWQILPLRAIVTPDLCCTD